jgi:predicted transcriptional regulator of viral defense system
MEKLIEKIKNIPKGYFSLVDIKKISSEKEGSLKVALSRLVKNEKIIKLRKNFYAVDIAKVDLENFAIETYSPSYLSFEWALAWHNVLSQKPSNLTLATAKRAKKTMLLGRNLIYRHLKPSLFWGYYKAENYLVADPEKAFLDLAYLSLNGYAGLDLEEMNLELLNKKKIKEYLERFDSARLNELIIKKNLLDL